MKAISALPLRMIVLSVASALCFQSGLRPACADEAAAKDGFPYVIQPELGASEFAPGDEIIITSLRGDREHLETGGQYLVEGRYTLASAESADLAWFSTSRGPSGPTPVTKDEQIRITKGSGNFRLKKTLLNEGWLHVSFYVDGHSHGGTYFGEKGVESTLLRKKSWSDFSNDRPAKNATRKTVATEDGGSASAEANAAIMAYLGNPVPAPANLDAKYSPTNLTAAFTALSRRASWRVEKLAVDDSEFPFLVYGMLAGKHDFREIEKGLREMSGYNYGGSVVGTTGDGSTYFSLNMIPYDQYPRDQRRACGRRLMVRLQMLANSARESE